MRQVVIELRDVFCVYRTAEGDAAALQGANLELHPGEVLCLLGPSGAGKSTLLQIVTGLRRPSAGLVDVLGCDIGRMTPRACARLRHRSMGLLTQSPHASLSPDLSAREAVALPLALRGVGRSARVARVEELLDAIDMRERAGDLPSQLSAGERQQLALCASVAHRPALLLADEPTGELDAGGAERVLELIGDLARRAGTSVIIASHDPVAAEFATRTVTMRDGRIVEERSGSRSTVVLGRGGSLALPVRLREQSRIGDRAYIESTPDGLLLRPVKSSRPSADRAFPPELEEQRLGWNAVEVELHRVTRRYGRGRPVIDAMTHTFTPGVLTVLSGRSGTGKTTLLRLVAGLDQADAGELVVDAVPVTDLDREQRALLRRRRIGYMSAEPDEIGFLSAQESVALALALRGWSGEVAARRAALALGAVGLADRAAQRVARLSAGEAQRVALARAFSTARGLLVVDEPSSHLDEANARLVAELLRRLARRHRQTVICATHDPIITECADEVLRLGEPALSLSQNRG